MDNSSCKSGGHKGRSATSVTLEWFARKIRRSNAIKNKLQTGSYQIDAEFVARSMLNEEDDVKGLK